MPLTTRHVHALSPSRPRCYIPNPPFDPDNKSHGVSRQGVSFSDCFLYTHLYTHPPALRTDIDTHHHRRSNTHPPTSTSMILTIDTHQPPTTHLKTATGFSSLLLDTQQPSSVYSDLFFFFFPHQHWHCTGGDPTGIWSKILYIFFLWCFVLFLSFWCRRWRGGCVVVMTIGNATIGRRRRRKRWNANVPYTLLYPVCLRGLPACLRDGKARGLGYPYIYIIIYQMLTLPPLLRVCFSSQRVSDDKRQAGCHTRWGHGSSWVMDTGVSSRSGGGRRWSSISWVLRRPPFGGGGLTCVCVCVFGRWGIKVTQIGRSPSPGLGIGSGLIGGLPVPGTYSGTYLRARRYSPRA